jgi:hypothetical protein
MIMEQGAVPPQGHRSADDQTLDERLAGVSPLGRAAVVVSYLAPRTSSDALDWITELAIIAGQHRLSIPELRRVATDLAWLARLAEQRCPGDQEWGLARDVVGSRMKRLVLAYVHDQRLRFDYRFQELRERSNEWLTEFRMAWISSIDPWRHRMPMTRVGKCA